MLVHRSVQLCPLASQLGATDTSMDEVATVSNGLDRERVYMEEQAILLRHDNNGVNVEIPSAEQSITKSKAPRVMQLQRQ